MWIGGRLHRGAHMSAGEFGHLVIEAGGPECECGRRGCVEAVQQRALAAELQRTLAGGAAYTINRAMPMDVPQDDRPADLVATGAAVMVLESVYGIPARPGEFGDRDPSLEPGGSRA